MMKLNKVMATFVLCAILCLPFAFFVQEAQAQDSDGPKKDATKGDGPTKLQMGLGVGSFIVMIIVVKWL